MTLAELRDFLNTLPEEVESCDVVYSEYMYIGEDLARKDTPIVFLAIDTDTNELILVDRKNTDTLYEYEAESEGD